MKTRDLTICCVCGRAYGLSENVEVCGNCGNETDFNVILSDSTVGKELGGEDE